MPVGIRMMCGAQQTGAPRSALHTHLPWSECHTCLQEAGFLSPWGHMSCLVFLTGWEVSKQVSESVPGALILLPTPVLSLSHWCAFGPGGDCGDQFLGAGKGFQEVPCGVL